MPRLDAIRQIGVTEQMYYLIAGRRSAAVWAQIN
jgi:hypothetical protein